MPADFANLLASNLQDMARITPELAVIATFLIALIVDLVVKPERRRLTAYVCMLGLLAALGLAARNLLAGAFPGAIPLNAPLAAAIATPASIFSNMLAFDTFGSFFKVLLLLGTLISLLLAVNARELRGRNQGEFFLLLVAVCLGGMFLVSATHLLMIYLSLESLSIVSYALAGYLRQNRKSAEAGIKYVIYGALASGLMIFGMSYLYGLTGTLDLNTLAKHLADMDPAAHQIPRGPLIAVLALVFGGFLYKIAAVPFHYWSPDVYEGAPTTATAFFSVVPKAAGFAVLIRVLFKLFPVSLGSWLAYPGAENVIAVLAIVTMTVGNLAALGQTNAKRMLAYSSIAHAGYMLAGLSVLGDGLGAAAVLFYLVVYLFMNLGAFLVLVALENTCGSCELGKLRGSIKREPVLGVALCIFLFSLTGIPPLGGFIGKYLIMLKLADQHRWTMIIWMGLNSVISLYYYMKLAKAVAIDKSEEELPPAPKNSAAFNVLAVCHSAVLLLLFVYFEPLRQICVQIMAPLR